MKQQLLDIFRFNRKANLAMLDAVMPLQEHKTEALRMLSHLVLSQDKWLTRIRMYPQDAGLDWWEPEIPVSELASAIQRSSDAWIAHIQSCAETELETEVRFIGYDGAHWGAKLQDIALQLSFHSFHHRAQVQMLLKAEGHQPAFIDYIGDKYYRIP